MPPKQTATRDLESLDFPGALLKWLHSYSGTGPYRVCYDSSWTLQERTHQEKNTEINGEPWEVNPKDQEGAPGKDGLALTET